MPSEYPLQSHSLAFQVHLTTWTPLYTNMPSEYPLQSHSLELQVHLTTWTPLYTNMPSEYPLQSHSLEFQVHLTTWNPVYTILPSEYALQSHSWLSLSTHGYLVPSSYSLGFRISIAKPCLGTSVYLTTWNPVYTILSSFRIAIAKPFL